MTDLLFSIHAWIPMLVGVTLQALPLLVLGRNHPLTRMILAWVCIGLAARYIWWRWTSSFPTDQEVWQDVWAMFFFVVESLTIFSSMLAYFYMSRKLDRGTQADQPISQALAQAPVDVFIATYNESREILERTLVGATSIEHPDIRVWVLDDGNRKWMKELAEEFGAFYAPRVKGKHAKAGNVNNGLWHALQTGRRPEFLLLLDADFVANRNIIKRTLPLFSEPDVGIVQTPQHFFNLDPVQSSLMCGTTWPDEQRFFFNELLPCKDAWGCAFCCGTSAVFRVEALVQAGGMAHETVTEDMLTTFKLLEYGWRTVFLNERLSIGLAPEGLAEYVGQRSRWCLGAIQQVYTRWSFAGQAKLGFLQRLSAFDGMLFWGAGFLFKLMMMAAPLIYWWTGTAVISSTVDDMLLWLAPYLCCTMIFMYFMASNRVIPIMTDVSHIVCSPTIVLTVIIGFLKPYGHKFKVTAKGTNSDGVTIQWRLLMPFMVMALGTVIGMVMNMNSQSTLYGTSGFTVNVFWSIFNVFVLCTACMVCVEMPRRRKDERFPTGENVILNLDAGGELHAVVEDISVGGTRLKLDGDEGLEYGTKGILTFADGETVAFQALRPFEKFTSLRFPDDVAVRRQLMRRLFTGLYINEVEKVRAWGSLGNVMRKIFG